TLAKRCLAPDLAGRPRQAGEVADAVAAYQAQVQERLRQGEGERAGAPGEAQEDRKRPRPTLVLASLMLVPGTGAAATRRRHQQQHAATELRLADAATGVREALKEATTLADSTEKMVQQPESWKSTLKAAFTALGQAETLLKKEPELDARELREQVQKV